MIRDFISLFSVSVVLFTNVQQVPKEHGSVIVKRPSVRYQPVKVPSAGRVEFNGELLVDVGVTAAIIRFLSIVNPVYY